MPKAIGETRRILHWILDHVGWQLTGEGVLEWIKSQIKDQWRKWLGALVTGAIGLIIGIVRQLPLWALSCTVLGLFVLVLLIWDIAQKRTDVLIVPPKHNGDERLMESATPPQQPSPDTATTSPVTRRSPLDPTTPILWCKGIGGINLGDLIAYTVAVENIQYETDNSAKNATLRLECRHKAFQADRPSILVEPGGWLPPENSGPMIYVNWVDIPSERFMNAVYLIGTLDHGVYLPISGGVLRPGEELKMGRWRVLVSVRPIDLQPFQFGVESRVTRDRNISDTPILVRESSNFTDWLHFKGDDFAD